MDEFNDLQVAAAGVFAVGLGTSVLVITSWIRQLLNLDGNAVRWAATGVASFVVVTFGLTQASWTIWGADVASGAAWASVGAYLVCVLASSASAIYERMRTDAS
jgi:hypothetical protein